MFVRIVKLIIKTEEISSFKTMFDEKKALIRNFPGCQFLELYQDKNNKEIFFTYSYWNLEEDLENYRHSTLFKAVWEETKLKFNGKPEAWSVNKLVSLS
ncbi:putative quinol monooxygenase [Croceibacter atlanticus]|jgi:heme-degrading monooxygenase HmoA|uniref:ABM domain-containing protein n=1 Tax=Croceibacter atlanticus (strain ATCC BAA-628 / JCM 21780 / CIP 108009 / IAM 15332 / KCTC 12090 / HTCC2559) TaxID=216432 RepID=A3UBN2_CROAH|nr:antibiotic biosynthesis monooxygenase family protein [Croceibacter atlanticus]EAP86033.1 hypothetical protein CA2559_08371 [Croceibacter atlanticus HTCC2559]MBW4969121.1 antibiotic biosynthesis monooxygenase [Croceibacter atlanticus]